MFIMQNILGLNISTLLAGAGVKANGKPRFPQTVRALPNGAAAVGVAKISIVRHGGHLRLKW